MNRQLQDALSELREETGVLCQRIRHSRTHTSINFNPGIVPFSDDLFAANRQVGETTEDDLLIPGCDANAVAIAAKPGVQPDGPYPPLIDIETLAERPNRSHRLLFIMEVNGFLNSWFPMLSNVGRRIDTLIRKSRLRQ
jgi:hypothetical protein